MKLISRRLVLFAVAFFLMVGCGNETLCDHTELLRITSPDNKVDAVLMRINCGATTAYSYKIYITPKGKSAEKSNPIFIADQLEGEIIEWYTSKHLTIRYKHARIFTFTNFWHSRDVDNFNYVVAIRTEEQNR